MTTKRLAFIGVLALMACQDKSVEQVKFEQWTKEQPRGMFAYEHAGRLALELLDYTTNESISEFNIFQKWFDELPRAHQEAYLRRNLAENIRSSDETKTELLKSLRTIRPLLVRKSS